MRSHGQETDESLYELTMSRIGKEPESHFRLLAERPRVDCSIGKSIRRGGIDPGAPPDFLNNRRGLKQPVCLNSRPQLVLIALASARAEYRRCRYSCRDPVLLIEKLAVGRRSQKVKTLLEQLSNTAHTTYCLLDSTCQILRGTLLLPAMTGAFHTGDNS